MTQVTGTQDAPPDGGEEAPETTWDRIAGPVTAVLTTAILVLLAVFVVAPAFNRPADVNRSEFRDGDGRVCLQVQAGRALAVDCDYQPLFRGNA